MSVLDRVIRAIYQRMMDMGRRPEEWQISQEMFDELVSDGQTIRYFEPKSGFLKICGVVVKPIDAQKSPDDAGLGSG